MYRHKEGTNLQVTHMGGKKKTTNKMKNHTLPQTSRVTYVAYLILTPYLLVLFFVTVTMTFPLWEIHIPRLLGGPHYLASLLPKISFYTSSWLQILLFVGWFVVFFGFFFSPHQHLQELLISKSYYLWTSQDLQNCNKLLLCLVD